MRRGLESDGGLDELGCLTQRDSVGLVSRAAGAIKSRDGRPRCCCCCCLQTFVGCSRSEGRQGVWLVRFVRATYESKGGSGGSASTCSGTGGAAIEERAQQRPEAHGEADTAGTVGGRLTWPMRPRGGSFCSQPSRLLCSREAGFSGVQICGAGGEVPSGGCREADLADVAQRRGRLLGLLQPIGGHGGSLQGSPHLELKTSGGEACVHTIAAGGGRAGRPCGQAAGCKRLAAGQGIGGTSGNREEAPAHRPSSHCIYTDALQQGSRGVGGWRQRRQAGGNEGGHPEWLQLPCRKASVQLRPADSHGLHHPIGTSSGACKHRAGPSGGAQPRLGGALALGASWAARERVKETMAPLVALQGDQGAWQEHTEPASWQAGAMPVGAGPGRPHTVAGIGPPLAAASRAAVHAELAGRCALSHLCTVLGCLLPQPGPAESKVPGACLYASSEGLPW